MLHVISVSSTTAIDHIAIIITILSSSTITTSAIDHVADGTATVGSACVGRTACGDMIIISNAGMPSINITLTPLLSVSLSPSLILILILILSLRLRLSPSLSLSLSLSLTQPSPCPMPRPTLALTRSSFDISALCHRPLLLYESVAILIRKCVGRQSVAHLPFRGEWIHCQVVQNIARRHASNLTNPGTARRARGLTVAVAPSRNTSFTEQVIAAIDASVGFVLEAHKAAFRLRGHRRTVLYSIRTCGERCCMDAQAFLCASPLRLVPLQQLQPHEAQPVAVESYGFCDCCSGATSLQELALLART